MDTGFNGREAAKRVSTGYVLPGRLGTFENKRRGRGIIRAAFASYELKTKGEK